jgi:hypothetical protein
MPRITPAEAGRRGGLIGGRSRSAAKLSAARRNGFQPTKPPEEASQPAPPPTAVPTGAPTAPVLLRASLQPKDAA